ncbi:MAG: 50S ribosomal protein L24 [Clostridiales Family XIII bacterium]|jgi:large subunit ribosomal protein L24|nr:50S ribosomal protein L24 [Clostridiales Family XIII bacterium]
MRIKKGDTVVVITGKDKGKKGQVIKTYPKAGRIIVEGVNVQTKHQKQTRKERSDIKHQEGAIDVSNVLYFDSGAGKGSKIGYKIDGGRKVRFAKKSGSIID